MKETIDELAALLAEKDRLLHELRVHQFELEAQNRSLREAQTSLEESQHRYADLYDFAPISYFTFDEKGRILEANLTGATMVGRDRQQVMGAPFAALVRMGDPAAFWAHLRRCAAERGPVSSELRFTSAAGPMDVQAVSSPVLDSAGRAVAFRTAFTDISQRRTAEAEQARLHRLAEQAHARSEALDEAGIAISTAIAQLPTTSFAAFLQVIADEARALVHAEYAAVGMGTDPEQSFDPWASSGMSPEAAAKLGRPPRAVGVLGTVARQGLPVRLRNIREHPAFQGFPPHHPDMTSFLAVPILFAGQSMGNLYLANKRDGEEFSEDDQQTIEMLADRVGFAIEIARVNAERDRKEAELRASIEARDNVLAVVSHDLRSPLNAITLGAGALALQPARAGEPQSRAVAIIRTAADRMAHLINDLLQAATIEAGRFTIEPALQPPQNIVDECVRMNEALAATKPVRLELRTEPDLPQIMVDHDRMVQALSNLVGNAIKFTPPEGTIRIALERTGAELRFTVSDTGPGVDEDVRTHLFDRYSKGRPSGRHGTGLGLYIAKGIVERHGGRIGLETGTGAGSTFFIALPLLPNLSAERRS